MIKRKITSLLIVLVMVVSCFGFAPVSAADSAALPAQYSLVTDLGITDKTQGNITRGDFCMMLANTIAYEFERESLTDHTNYPFEDVTPSIAGYDAIRYLSDIGIVNGYNQNLFLPDKEITLAEAVAIIMRHLKMEGVTDETRLYSLAFEYKLLKDITISSSDILDARNAIILIYNLMHMDISNSKEYYYDNGRYFYQAMGLETLTGMVTDDGVCSINGESTMSAGMIRVGNEVYYNHTGKKDLFAYEIYGYYSTDTKTRDKIIVSLTTEEDEKVVFDADQIVSYANYRYKIADGDTKVDTYNVSKGFNLVYNGRIVEFDDKLTDEIFADMMTPETGSVMLVDTDNDNRCDIVRIKSYHNMVAGTVSRNVDGSISIINKYDSSDSFVIDGDVDVSVITSEGNARTVDSISRDTAVSIAVSYDGDAVEIILGSNARKGKIKEKGEDSFLIDTSEYEISYEFAKLLEKHPEKSPSLGRNGTYYLTFENKILYYDGNSYNDFLYALFGKTAASGFDYMISFYTEENNYIILTLEDKVKIDGKPYKVEDAKKYFDTYKYDLNCTMVRVKYDDEMHLTEIDTPYVEADGFVSNGKETAASLHYIKNLKNKDYQYKAWLTSFANQVCVTDDTKMFFLPEGEDDIKEARVITQTSTKFSDNTGVVTISAFSANEDALVADAMFIRDYYYPNVREPDENEKLQVVVIKRVIQVLTSDGEKATALEVTDGYYENTYIYEPQTPVGYYYENGETKTQALGVGDIIKIGVDDENRIPDGNIILIYDCSEKIQHYKGTSYTVPGNWTWSGFCTPGGYIYRKVEGYIEFTETDPAIGLNYNEHTTYIFPTSKANVLIIDADEAEIEYKTMTDVISYKDSETLYDKNVIINNRAGELLAVFVYR